MKIIKLILINFSVFFTSILIVELTFGGWFKKDNLGAYFREHRMKKVPYSIKYNNKIYDYIYKRNYYGFKGEKLKPSKIKAVFIGGSTADERWKPDEYSIVEQLNKKLKDDKINIKIVNSAIEGQSTTGYIANFNFWYPKLENFNPDYFIFYTGINELFKPNYGQWNYSNNREKLFGQWDYSDGRAKILNRDKKERFGDNLKSKSFFYDSLRKIKHKYYTREKRIFMDLDKPYNPPDIIKLEKYDYLKFNEAYKKKENIQKLLIEHKHLVRGFLRNIDRLINYSKKYSAEAIFINQVTAFGAHDEKHLILNYALNKHCKEKNYSCIDIAKDFIGKQNYWYDGIHTTPLGSKEISKTIYPKLLDFIKFDN